MDHHRQCSSTSNTAKQWFVVSLIFIGYFCLSIYEGKKITSWQNNNPVPIRPIQVNVLPTNVTTDSSSKPIFKKSVKNVMVVTSWRSGSTLIGELLNSYPNSFYSYEPLHHLDIRRAYAGDRDAKSADKVIKGLLTCNYDPVLQEYVKVGTSYTKAAGGELITRNAYLKGYCRTKGKRFGLCSSAEFLNKMCQESKFRIMKTVRLGLNVAQQRFFDPATQEGLKMIYIARDPRGLYNSRLHRDWCVAEERCISPQRICQDLESDFWTAKALATSQKNDFMVLRYEEFSLDIWNKSQELFSFLGFDLSDASRKFLTDHTQKEKYKAKPEVWNTFRDPKDTPFHWMQSLTFEQILKVQKDCHRVLELWGYQVINTKKDLKSVKNPLLKFKLN